MILSNNPRSLKSQITVTFENTITSIDSQLIREDKLITNPGTPIKKYYEFKGWYDGDKLFDFNTQYLTKSTTLPLNGKA